MLCIESSHEIYEKKKKTRKQGRWGYTNSCKERNKENFQSIPLGSNK